MPLQYAVPYKGSDYLFQGISGAGQSIGEGINSMMKRMKQAKAMRGMLTDVFDMDAEQADKMSLEDAQQYMQGKAIASAQKDAEMRRQMDQAHANYYNRFNQKAEREDAFSAAVDQYMQPKPMAPGASGPVQQPTMDPQTLMRLEAQAGTLDPDKAMQYMKQLGAGKETFFDPHGMMAEDIPGVPNAKRVVLGPNQSEVLRVNGEAPEAPPGYQMVADGKGGWKPVKLNTGELSAADRTKYQAQYEKNIDALIQSYSFAKGDPEMEALIKERIASHRAAIKDLQSPAKEGAPDSGRKAMGGYKIGAVYAGLKYLGGEPTDSASWEKVK